jgi:hypothetical protein
MREVKETKEVKETVATDSAVLSPTGTTPSIPQTSPTPQMTTTDAEITLRFRYVLDDYKKFNDESLHRFFIHMIPAFIVGIVLIVLCATILNNGTLFIPVIITIIATLLIWTVVLITASVARANRSAMKQLSQFPDDIKLTISNKGVAHSINSGHSIAKIEWGFFSKVVERKNAFQLVHRSLAVSLLVPKRAFTQAQLQEFRDILLNNQVTFAKK